MKRFKNNENPNDEFSKQLFLLNENSENENDENSFYSKFGNFDQLTINDYMPGDGIPPHVDSHSPFEDVFCSLSLGSGTVMSFVSPENTQHNLYLKPRSAVFFSGDARFIYEHLISLRKLDRVEDSVFFRKRRISLTFRRIKKEGECKCPFTKFCDSKKTLLTNVSALDEFKIDLNNPVEEGKPTDIEKKACL